MQKTTCDSSLQRQDRPPYAGLFALVVVLLATYISRHFILAILWAAILAVATWPLFLRLLALMRERRIPAALLCTLVVAMVFVAPIVYLLAEAGKQAPVVAQFLAEANANSISMPAALARLPMVGDPLQAWWSSTLAQPHGLSHLLSGTIGGRLGTARELLRAFGTHTLHSAVTFGFAVASLFFFYINGDTLRQQIDVLGKRSIGPARWTLYVRQLPLAIRSTVNGLVLVGLGEGILLGISYAVAGLPSAVLFGALTAALAIVPFGALAAYVCASLYLFALGNVAGGVGVLVWGSVVLLLADHVVRPRIIGGATKMPFLIVLFGLLGGVESFGLIGLFLGPAIMTLFVTLWRESQFEVAAP